MLKIRILPAAILFCTELASVHAEGAKPAGSGPPVATSIRTETTPTIDGRLDDPVWRQALPETTFTQRDPNEGAPVTEATEVRILYDQGAIYFGIRCFDSEPDRIVAHEMQYDSDLDDDDYFEIMLDTYLDGRNTFYFATNPNGAKMDGYVGNEGQSFNFDWDGVWQCEAQIDEQGWTAEIAIPFRTLRFKEGATVWGANFGRGITRKRERVYWSPILRDYGFLGAFKVSKYGRIEGLSDIKQGGRLEVKPYLIGGGTGSGASYARWKGAGDVGLDAKYRVTPNLNADITYNTDFAQVEADEERINLSRFSLYFPEKRAFFLEGATIFRTGERYKPFGESQNLLFFSRTIGLSDDGEEIPIIGGTRVTGKLGQNDVGLLSVFTDEKSYVNDDDEDVFVPRTNFSVFRLKRDIHTKSNVGVIALGKQGADGFGHNRVAAVDANFVFSPKLQAGGFMGRSQTSGAGGDGIAFNADIMYDSDRFDFDLSHLSIAEEFNDEMGFILRDGRKTRLNTGFSIRPATIPWIRQTFFFNDFVYITDHHNVLETRANLTASFSILERGGWFFVGLWDGYEYLDEGFDIHDGVTIPAGTYGFRQAFFALETNQNQPLSIEADMGGGEFFHGRIASLALEANLRASHRILAKIGWQYNRLSFPADDVNAPDYEFDGDVDNDFQTHVVSMRFNYSFSPKLFANTFVQWNDDEKRAILNFRLNWIHAPGSDFYLVYNEELDTAGGKLTSRNRAILAKFDYLLNL